MTKPWPVPDFDSDASVSVIARAMIAVRAAELFSYNDVFPDAKAVTALHNARIAAKRLRYTLELFADVFGAEGEALLEEIKALQEELGVVHDRDVLIATIETSLGELIEDHGATTDAVRASLEVVLGRVTEERKARHRAVATQWMLLAKGEFRARLEQLGALRDRDAPA